MILYRSFRANHPALLQSVKINHGVQLDFGSRTLGNRILPRGPNWLWGRPHRGFRDLVISLIGGVHVLHKLLGADCAVGVDISLEVGWILRQSVEGIHRGNRDL